MQEVRKIIDATVTINAVVWIRSLPENELGPSERTIEDVQALAEGDGLRFELIEVTDWAGLCNAFTSIIEQADRGSKPIIHLDMHGDKDNGLLISPSGHRFSWQLLSEFLRDINVRTKNNLVCISWTCFGLHVLKALELGRFTPFHALIASDDEIDVGFLEANTLPFYKELLSGGSLNRAHAATLSTRMQMFHCERMLLTALSGYVRDFCRGRRLRQRREELLTKIMSASGVRENMSLKKARVLIEEGLRVNAKLLDDYALRFLGKRDLAFTIEDVIALSERKVALQTS